MKTEKIRQDAREIFQAGLTAADPVRAVQRNCRVQGNRFYVGERYYDLTALENIYVLGTGKASAAMAQPIEELLGRRIKAGVINVKYGHTVPLSFISLCEAGHPVPDEAGINGTQEIVKLLEQAGENDLVIFLISGGGSALLPAPASGLTLSDIQQTTQILLNVGATIHEMNALRKHLSQVKGGQLAKIAYPAALAALILSDVIGDNLDIIASGPTAPDSSTFQDCLAVVAKYNIQSKMPAAVYAHLEKGIRGEAAETPGKDDAVFQKIHNHIIGSNTLAVKAAQKKAEELGYNSLILSSFIEGETKEVAKVHTAIAREIMISGNPVAPPACIISGGETTVTIKGPGKGGRNQEFVLAAAIEISGWKNIVVLSGGTDGNDGPTDAAGAIADGKTLVKAESLGKEAALYLSQNDSYHFFQPLNDLLMTGPTNTNVMDLRLLLVAN